MKRLFLSEPDYVHVMKYWHLYLLLTATRTYLFHYANFRLYSVTGDIWQLKYSGQNTWRRRVLDCKGLTNQAIKWEVIMSSFSWAGRKKNGLAAFHIHAEGMNKLMFGGMKIEISHRDILLTSFSDRPYLHTFSPVNMMMNNISWSAAEYVSHGESPGRFWLLLVFSSFLYTTISLRGRVKWGVGRWVKAKRGR